MPHHTAYVSLGSNLGDRLSVLESAVAAIEERLGVAARSAAPFESAPWGFESRNPFVNIGIAFETTLEPIELHRCLQQVQHSIDPSPHRDASGAYIDRRIDIDLIAVDGYVVDTPELTLPHPRMHLRRFVLEPMAELDPRWHHPVSGLTCAEMLVGLDKNA